jgi:Holliday junction resolvase-like predicted endonuclease
MAKTAPAQDKLLALRTGERGETLALRWAMAQGWQLYGQRLRVERCEVDLAMVREKPGQPRELLLIEVKTSRRQGGDHALRWGKAQQARLWGAAEALMNQSNSQQVQVALVVVTLQADREHVRWLIAEPF